MKKYISILIISSIFISCSTQKTAPKVLDCFMKTPDLSKVIYDGGDGTSIENAVIIKNAGNENNGIASEYNYITKIHGEKFKYWKPVGQSTIAKNDKIYDLVDIEITENNKKIAYYFDITDFYGKF